MADLVAPLLIYTLSAGADLGSTEYALRNCSACVESNPLLQSREARIGRGIAGVALATLLDVQLQKKAPKWRWVPRVVIPLVSGIIAVHNVRAAK